MSSLAATDTASSRFAGPSAPGIDAGRMAPVNTIGASASWIRSHSNAVSSSVSVPCVTTVPTPRRAESRAARQISSCWLSVRWALGEVNSVRDSMSRLPLSDGTDSSIAAASRPGVASWVPVIPIVPPAPSTSTRRLAPTPS